MASWAHRDDDDRRGKMAVDGRERTYEFQVPNSYSGTRAIPLVLAFHGTLGTGSGEEKLAHLDKVSDEHGFLVVYPNGLDRSWADGRTATPSDKNGVDDVKLISALLDKMEHEYNVDANRIYVERRIHERTSGLRLVEANRGRCDCCRVAFRKYSRHMPSSQTGFGNDHSGHRTSASAATRRRSPARRSRRHGPSHAAAVRKFVQLNRCGAEPKTEHIVDHAGDGTSVDAELYSGRADWTEVRGYVVNRGGHTWPKGMQYLPAAMIGKTTHNLDGSELMWSFFSGHQR